MENDANKNPDDEELRTYKLRKNGLIVTVTVPKNASIDDIDKAALIEYQKLVPGYVPMGQSKAEQEEVPRVPPSFVAPGLAPAPAAAPEAAATPAQSASQTPSDSERRTLADRLSTVIQDYSTRPEIQDRALTNIGGGLLGATVSKLTSEPAPQNLREFVRQEAQARYPGAFVPGRPAAPPVVPAAAPQTPSPAAPAIPPAAPAARGRVEPSLGNLAGPRVPERASGPRIEGGSGAVNWLRSQAGQEHEVPYNKQMAATSMRKNEPTGAQRIIDEDLARLRQIERMEGQNRFRLGPSAPGQLLLPTNIAEEQLLREAQRLQAEQLSQQSDQARAQRAFEQATQQSAREQERAQTRAERSVRGGAPLGLYSIFRRYPGIYGGAMGAVSAEMAQRAADAYESGRMTEAAVAGAGALGSAVGMFPNPYARMIGLGSSALISPLAIYLQQKNAQKSVMEQPR